MSTRTPPTLIGAAAAAVLALTTLTGCTVFDSVVQGVSSGVGGAFSGSDDDADSGTGSSQPTTPDVVIEVRFDGDAETGSFARVDVDSPNSGTSYREDSVKLPFSKEFRVATDVILPFRGVTASIEVPEGGKSVSCEILIDDRVVASGTGSGNGSRAECERRLRLGPS